VFTTLDSPQDAVVALTPHIRASITRSDILSRFIIIRRRRGTDRPNRVLGRILPKSVRKAEKHGEIWRVLNKVQGMDTGTGAKLSTFVRRVDVLFGATARDSDGRMTQIPRGSSAGG
jgi:hypothetical protein